MVVKSVLRTANAIYHFFSILNKFIPTAIPSWSKGEYREGEKMKVPWVGKEKDSEDCGGATERELEFQTLLGESKWESNTARCWQRKARRCEMMRADRTRLFEGHGRGSRVEGFTPVQSSFKSLSWEVENGRKLDHVSWLRLASSFVRWLGYSRQPNRKPQWPTILTLAVEISETLFSTCSTSIQIQRRNGNEQRQRATDKLPNLTLSQVTAEPHYGPASKNNRRKSVKTKAIFELHLKLSSHISRSMYT